MKNYFEIFFKTNYTQLQHKAEINIPNLSHNVIKDNENKLTNLLSKSKSSDKNSLLNKKHILSDKFAKIRYDEIQSHIYSFRIKDSRERVNQTLDWPYSAIGALLIKFNNDFWLGTATLISEDILLTAAHNIYVKNEFIGSEIEFYPGINNNEVVCSMNTKIKQVYISEKYIDDSDITEDYAIILLENPIGKLFGYFGLNSLEIESNYDARDFFLYGYPGDKIRDKPGYYEMWGRKLENVKILSDGYIEYYVDTYSGMSGAGVWYKEKSDDGEINCYLIGVHVAHNPTNRKGYAVHLNEQRLDTIYKQVYCLLN